MIPQRIQLLILTLLLNLTCFGSDLSGVGGTGGGSTTGVSTRDLYSIYYKLKIPENMSWDQLKQVGLLGFENDLVEINHKKVSVLDICRTDREILSVKETYLSHLFKTSLKTYAPRMPIVSNFFYYLGELDDIESFEKEIDIYVLNKDLVEYRKNIDDRIHLETKKYQIPLCKSLGNGQKK